MKKHLLSVTGEVEATLLTHKLQRIKRARKEAFSGQQSQAKIMIKRSRVDFVDGKEGDNEVVQIPMVDRGRGDARNIMGIIVHRDISTDMYTIAVKAGILRGKYSRNQFDLCAQTFLQKIDVNLEQKVSLRSAVIAKSTSRGQGFVKYNCKQKLPNKQVQMFKSNNSV